MGVRGPSFIDARTRLQGYHMWDVTDFLLNALLFVLVGLQLPIVVDGLDGWGVGELILYAIAISVAVTGARFLWFWTVPYLIRGLDRRPQQLARRVGWRPRIILVWAGMRGSVSLAAALALPLETDAGAPFPHRDLIIFLVFCVIFTTLVVQGLTLPMLIRRLGVEDDGSERDGEDVRARLAATNAALERIDTIEQEGSVTSDTAERMRGMYHYRVRRLNARAGDGDGEEDYEERSMRYQQAVKSVLDAQRREAVRLRDQGEISNEVMNSILRELDLEEARLEI
jgi:monovalent cation/hydrogen antiporter